MWWFDRCTHDGRKGPRIARVAMALTIPLLVGGCFEPLYGQRSLAGGPSMGQRLGGISIDPIDAQSASPEARIAVALRNALIFEFTGGGEGGPTTHRLRVRIGSTRQQVIVDITTARPDIELVGFHAHYTLTEVATGKVVVTGQTFARASYDIPGQQQRFAGARGQLDAQERTAKVIAEAIRSRLASYFVAGT
jgi:LPS-assembly lipoprotein